MAAVSIWGTLGNQAYALPMVALTPPDPLNNGYALYWNINAGALDFAPMNFNPNTGDAVTAGNFGVAASKVFQVAGTQVVAARQTGWTANTGTPIRTGFNTATVTLAQLAAAVAALQADLTTHGLIGA